jgi:hypothetical protein
LVKKVFQLGSDHVETMCQNELSYFAD